MKICVPSYKRANDCKAARLLSKAVIFCHEFEAKEYAKYNKNQLELIPDGLQGQGMGKIRNFILGAIKENESLVMVDDDVSKYSVIEKGEIRTLEEWEIYYLFESLERMAREANTSVFGINQQSDRKFYREYSPFSFTSPILGPTLGIIKTELRFDDDLGLKEDYDYAIQAIRKHRRILRFNKYSYTAGHINKKGGCSIIRTTDREKEQMQRLVRKWGEKIVKGERRTQGGNVTINPLVTLPIRGI